MQPDRKGQVSTEYITIVGFLLAVVGIMAAYALVTYNESTKLSQVQSALMKLKNSSENTYAFGPGNKETVKIFLPKGTTGSSVQNNKISFNVDLFGGTQTFEAILDVNVSGTLPSAGGLHHIQVSLVDKNIVFSGG